MAAVDIEPYPFYPDEAEQDRANQVQVIDAQALSAPAPVTEVIEARVIEPVTPKPEALAKPEQRQAYRLDVGVAEHGPVGSIQTIRNASQRLYAIIEGNEYTINDRDQRDPAQDKRSTDATALATRAIADYWGRNTARELSVEDAATLMHNSLTIAEDILDMADSSRKANGEASDKELNHHAVAIRFFEDTDGNLRAVYGRSGRGTVLSQTGLNNPVEFARPEDREDWQPTFVDVTPPLTHNTRLVLSSHGLTPVLEQQEAEVLAQAYDHNSEQAAAEALLQLGAATKARAEAQGALVIDVVKDPSAAKTPASDQTVTASSFAKITNGSKEEAQSSADEAEDEEPISWRDVVLGTKVLALEGIEKSKALAKRTRDIMGNARGNLRKLFGRGKTYVQSGEFTRRRKQISGRVLGALATAKEATPSLVSRERYAGISQKLGHLARSAYLAPVNAPQLIAKAGEYFRDEEKGKRRAYVAYAGGIAVATAFAYFASKGFSLDHHASEAHQQALNHLPKGTGSSHAQAAHHAVTNTAPAKQPSTVTPPTHQTAPAPAAPSPANTAPVTPPTTFKGMDLNHTTDWTVANVVAPGHETQTLNAAAAKFHEMYGTQYVLTPHDGTIMFMNGPRVINPLDQLHMNQILAGLV